MNEYEVVAALSMSIEDSSIGYVHNASVINTSDIRPVSGEVIIVARLRQSSQWAGLKCILQQVHGQTADSAGIYPRSQYYEGMRLIQVRNGFIDLESAYIHVSYILTTTQGKDKQCRI